MQATYMLVQKKEEEEEEEEKKEKKKKKRNSKSRCKTFDKHTLNAILRFNAKVRSAQFCGSMQKCAGRVCSDTQCNSAVQYKSAFGAILRFNAKMRQACL